MVKASEVPTNQPPMTRAEMIASAAMLPDRPEWWHRAGKKRSVQWARAQHWLRFSDNHPSSSPGYRTSYLQEIAGAVDPCTSIEWNITSAFTEGDAWNPKIDVVGVMLAAQAMRLGAATRNGFEYLTDAEVSAEASEVAQADDVTNYIPTHPGTEPNDKAIDARGRDWAHDRSDGFGRDGFEFLGFAGPDLRTDPDRPPNNLLGGV